LRYIPHSKADVKAMLEKIGAKNVEELFEQIPESLRFKGDLDLPEPLSEPELMAHLSELAGPSPADGRISFMGAGVYQHHIPPAVDQLLLRSEFYTAYTPYQPEISQGTLQAIFEFQTMICRIFSMGVANASMYDGATALTEAGLMARRATKRELLLVSAAVHPEYRETLETYLRGLDGAAPKIQTIPINPQTGATSLKALEQLLSKDVAAVLVGYPNFFGVIEPLDEIVTLTKAVDTKKPPLVVSATAEPFSLGLIAAPGDLGVDIAVGEGQPIATPLSYGGPGLGLFSCRNDKKLVRQMPGRLVGQTKDVNGETGYVLTLSTREQHIRREKATSNICSNHGLCAVSATINLSLLGKVGFVEVAKSCLARAEYLKKGIAGTDGFSLKYSGATFNEFAVTCLKQKASDVLARLADRNILGGVDMARFDSTQDDTFLVAVTECTSRKMLDAFLDALKSV
jgi:glycine cleavage system P protein (glycine dehydrogenase) subunit 1